MDKFEALYHELYTHAVVKMPLEDVADRRLSVESKSSLGLDVCEESTLAESCTPKSEKATDTDGKREDSGSQSSGLACDIDCYRVVKRESDGSMTNLFGELEGQPLENVVEEKTPQEMWEFLTNVSPIFNRMRFYLVSWKDGWLFSKFILANLLLKILKTQSNSNLLHFIGRLYILLKDLSFDLLLFYEIL